MMAVATIAGVGRNPFPPSGGDLAAVAIPVALPLLVLAIPFLDVVLAIVRRMRKGLGIHHADKEHIHHRLMDIGHSQRQAVVLMYLWSALISGCALAVAFIDGRLLVLGIVTVAMLVAAVLPRLLRDRAPRGSDIVSVAEASGGTGMPLAVDVAPNGGPRVPTEAGAPAPQPEAVPTGAEPDPRGAAAG
jgi:UDP-GlcNAc:undecaprenyl-phosphate GlcNAc-1-phosphate transferase